MRNSQWKIYGVIGAVVVIAAVAYRIVRADSEVRYNVYVGGYGGSAVKCIFNSKTSNYSVVRDFEAANPSFLALSPSSEYLFGVSESGKSSGVWGYENSASAKSLGQAMDGGADPCYIAYFQGHLFTANYGKGGISVFPLDTAGNVKPAVQILNFVAEGRYKNLSHNHMVKVIYGRKSKKPYLLSADKGLDRIHVMRIGEDTLSVDRSNLSGKTPLRLYRCDSAYISVPEGYGPRHFDISKDGKFLYLLCEISGMILVYSIDERNDNIHLSLLQETVADTHNMRASADIHLSPDGRFLYASNRKGKDGIAIFLVGEDGLLSRIAYQVTGQWPRSFAITPDGEYMFVCCQKDKMVQIFRIDNSSGYLVNTGKVMDFTDLEPSCVLVRSI